MKSIQVLVNLRELGLRNNRVTDAGLIHLKKMSALEKITLAGTQVTSKGVAELQREMPELMIVR